jgi:hypothetical protein
MWLLVPKRGLDDTLAASLAGAVHEGAVELSGAANVAVKDTTLEQIQKPPANPPRPSALALAKRVFTQRVIILLGLGCLGFTACFVPWVHTDNQGVEVEPAGYHFIFRQPAKTHYGLKIDLSRAIVPMVFILGVTAGFAYLRREKTAESEPISPEPEKPRLVTRVELPRQAAKPKVEDLDTWPN